MISSLLILLLQPAGLPPCDQDKVDQGIQQEMNICAAHDFYTADTALNEAWAAARERMKRLDKSLEDYPGPPEVNQQGYFETMLNAQRAWLTYRDEHCRSEGYRARGGSLEPLLVLTCKTALTQARTEQLCELATPY